jgi:hypothetical protein
MQARSISPSLVARFIAEKQLAHEAMPGDRVLCFGNLPPLFSLAAHVTLFVQNRLLIDGGDLRSYPPFVRLRLLFERQWLAELGRLIRTAQNFKLDFLLETSQLLRRRDEAQGDLGTLPTCCFTISKLRLAGSISGSSKKKRGKKLSRSSDIRTRFCHIVMTLGMVFTAPSRLLNSPHRPFDKCLRCQRRSVDSDSCSCLSSYESVATRLRLEVTAIVSVTNSFHRFTLEPLATTC